MSESPKNLGRSFSEIRERDQAGDMLKVLLKCEADFKDAIDAVRAWQMRANIERAKVAPKYEDDPQMDYLRTAVAREKQRIAAETKPGKVVIGRPLDS